MHKRDWTRSRFLLLISDNRRNPRWLMTVFLPRAARRRIGEAIKSCPLLTRILDIRTRAEPNEIALGIPRARLWNAQRCLREFNPRSRLSSRIPRCISMHICSIRALVRFICSYNRDRKNIISRYDSVLRSTHGGLIFQLRYASFNFIPPFLYIVLIASLRVRMQVDAIR